MFMIMNNSKLQLESELQSNWWRVRFNDITFLNSSEKPLEANRLNNKSNDRNSEQKNKSLVFQDKNNFRITTDFDFNIPRKAIYKV